MCPFFPLSSFRSHKTVNESSKVSVNEENETKGLSTFLREKLLPSQTGLSLCTSERVAAFKTVRYFSNRFTRETYVQPFTLQRARLFEAPNFILSKASPQKFESSLILETVALITLTRVTKFFLRPRFSSNYISSCLYKTPAEN